MSPDRRLFWPHLINAAQRQHVHAVTVGPGQEVSRDLSVYGAFGERAICGAREPLEARNACFVSALSDSLLRIPSGDRADVEALEDDVTVGVASHSARQLAPPPRDSIHR